MRLADVDKILKDLENNPNLDFSMCDACWGEIYTTIDNAPTELIDWGADDGDRTVYATKTGEWVKVEDALPSDSSIGCLVTVFETNPFTQEDFETVLPYFVGYDGETWNDCQGNVIPFEVIAWMRVPEPYIWKGGETNDTKQTE